jgi:hypothetical protein
MRLIRTVPLWTEFRPAHLRLDCAVLSGPGQRRRPAAAGSIKSILMGSACRFARRRGVHFSPERGMSAAAGSQSPRNRWWSRERTPGLFDGKKRRTFRPVEIVGASWIKRL